MVTTPALWGDPLDDVASGCFRWAVNSSSWDPAGGFAGAEFQYLLSLVPEAPERAEVGKTPDFRAQKEALISRLLCRRAAAAVLGHTSFRSIRIARTNCRKPFLSRPRPPWGEAGALANFNFNLSHDGDWVVLASEPQCLCGVDVTDGNFVFMDSELWLTPDEAELIRGAPATETVTGVPPNGRRSPATAQQHMTMRIWSLKEAFTKARGDGLNYHVGLHRIDFQFHQLSPEFGNWNFLAQIRVDGELDPDWLFYQQRLDADHWLSIARGPSRDAYDPEGEFLRTLRRPSTLFSKDELHSRNPSIIEVPVEFLVPDDDVERYVALGGQPWTLKPPLVQHIDASQDDSGPPSLVVGSWYKVLTPLLVRSGIALDSKKVLEALDAGTAVRILAIGLGDDWRRVQIELDENAYRGAVLARVVSGGWVSKETRDGKRLIGGMDEPLLLPPVPPCAALSHA